MKIVKQIRRQARKASRKASKIARIIFAPYVVVDSYGTVQCEWTLAGAISWIEFASPHVMIWHRWNGALVASRVMSDSEA